MMTPTEILQDVSAIARGAGDIILRHFAAPIPTSVKGTRSDIVTAADAQVVLWNGETAGSEVELSLGDARAADDEVGSVTVTGPLDEATVAVRLDGAISEPDAWWRLTHPLQLFGLAD